MTQSPRAPQAFKLETETATKTKKLKIDFEAEQPAIEIAIIPNSAELPLQRGARWGAILISALFGLASLWAALTITTMIESFFARSPFLGWLALAVAGLAGFAALAIVLREIWGLFRLRRIEKLQLTAAHAINQDDDASATLAITELKKLYANRPDQSWNLKTYQTHEADIIDPRDRVRLAERYLVEPLDEMAHRIIAKRAKRVTLLTTITPAAALDILFVATQNIRMIRELASLYGGRPSTLATFRLTRMVLTHLAVAGGLAMSQNFLHIFVGKGLLGRLSTRFGEGAVNGILTTRIGLAACDVCRPIPQEATRRETLSSLLKELASFGDSETSKT